MPAMQFSRLEVGKINLTETTSLITQAGRIGQRNFELY